MLLVLVTLIAQSPAKPAPKVQVIKGSRAKAVAKKSQAELDAEARAEDRRLRCEEDPASCAGPSPDLRAKELSTKEDALRRRERDLEDREAQLKQRQDDERDEKERLEKQRADQKRQLERQTKQLEQVMHGVEGALSGE